MDTIIRLLHEAAGRYPGRAYTTMKTDSGWKPWTFSDIDEESQLFAAALIERGFGRSTPAGIVAEGRPQWIAAEFGIVKAGCISVPMSIKLTPEEIAFRINHSESGALVVSANTLKKAVQAYAKFDARPLLIYLDGDDKELRKAEKELSLTRGKESVLYSVLLEEGRAALENDPDLVSKLEAEIQEDDTVNICYTSGTTGNPKGIMLTHKNYVANAEGSVELFQLPDAVYETLVVLPLDHSFAHTVGLYASLLRGITLHFVDARGGSMNIIRNLPINLKEVNPHFMLTVPAISGNFMKKMTAGIAEKGGFIQKLFLAGLRAGIARNGDGYHKASFSVRLKTAGAYTAASKLIFPKLREVFGSRIEFCVGGGALLEVRQQDFFAAIGLPIFQGYGLTEAAPVICSNTPHTHKFGTSGLVAPNVTCRIMRDDGSECPPGERGEIVIKGDNVMKGYFKNKAASEEVLKEDWLWTGDLGYFDEDGFLVVTGRAKALLIAPDGEKHSPEEIEEAIINTCDLVSQVMVYNDHRKFTTGLITLQAEPARKALAAAGAADARQALEVLKKHLGAFEPELKKTVSDQWIPSVFEIIPDEFSEENGLVNSTMKLVRYRVAEFYKERIEAMYADNNFFNERNLAAMEKLFGYPIR
jgi:long-chain acyl-CoA synthetase